MQIAWIFPGQGSQKIGMAKDVIKLEDAKRRFEYASNVFNKDLYRICEEQSKIKNQENDLNNTRNTQICLFLVESILLDSLKKNGFQASYFAGHSLGEITALYAADVLNLEDCVSLINVRSELMANAKEGSMAALIGFDRDEVNNIVATIDDVVIANDNSSSQIVLSGTESALENISNLIQCKRFIKLNVSGAFHSHLMEEPSLKFVKYLQQLNFNNASLPVISNSNPTFSTDAGELKKRLEKQMCNGVRWRETMDLMNIDKPLHIVEIGPSNVLGGIAKRYLKDVKISQVSDSDNLSY